MGREFFAHHLVQLATELRHGLAIALRIGEDVGSLNRAAHQLEHLIGFFASFFGRAQIGCHSLVHTLPSHLIECCLHIFQFVNHLGQP